MDMSDCSATLDSKAAERFWSRVDQSGGPDACWPWTMCRLKPGGYGLFHIPGGKNVTAHRLAYRLDNGPIAAGLCVCHKCDHPECCNPSHLFLGTQADNVADRHAKGKTASGDRHGKRLHPESIARGPDHWACRNPERARRGEAAARARLTADAVVAIRAAYANGTRGADLAEQYGVTRGAIAAVVTGLSWAHVAGPIFPPGSGRKRSYK